MANSTFSAIDINKATADFNNALKEGAYIAVGLGVLAFQRAQVRRVELAKQLEAQRGEVAKQFEAQRGEVAKQLKSQRQQLGRLPGALSAQFENYGQTARTQGDVARAQLADQLSTLSRNLEETVGPALQGLARLAQNEGPQLPDLGEQFKDSAQILEDRLATIRDQLTDLVRALDEWLQPARQQLDEQLDRLEQRLPAGAREGVHSVREAGAASEQAMRARLGLD